MFTLAVLFILLINCSYTFVHFVDLQFFTRLLSVIVITRNFNRQKSNSLLPTSPGFLPPPLQWLSLVSAMSLKIFLWCSPLSLLPLSISSPLLLPLSSPVPPLLSPLLLALSLSFLWRKAACCQEVPRPGLGLPGLNISGVPASEWAVAGRRGDLPQVTSSPGFKTLEILRVSWD